MIYVVELVFGEDTEEHIARHHIVLAEVVEVCVGQAFVSRTRRDRLRVIGRTRGGRYVVVILQPLGRGRYAAITARDATVSERRLYQRQAGG